MTSHQRYSLLDRLIHRLAFASPAVQWTAADVERLLYGRQLRAIRIDRPIFVTSLPRAGTTLLLQLLAGLPDVATHLYRDMPFILAPLLWQGLSKSFRKPDALIERAHGDGMMVGYDSPEAFEEVLWKAFWPSHFAADRITLWKDDAPAGDFRDVFTSHMQRIIAARFGADVEHRRYVSKNNANVARVGFLKGLIPDVIVVVPFRDPITQAASLQRQHLRFLLKHRDDPFGRRYMEDIGHLEFGALHRPMAFDGMEEVRARHRPESLDYWIGYWLQGFRHIRAQQPATLLVSYERLCTGGAASVRAVIDAVGLTASDDRLAALATFYEPQSPALEAEDIRDGDQLAAAQAVHGQLLTRSIV